MSLPDDFRVAAEFCPPDLALRLESAADLFQNLNSTLTQTLKQRNNLNRASAILAEALVRLHNSLEPCSCKECPNCYARKVLSVYRANEVAEFWYQHIRSEANDQFNGDDGRSDFSMGSDTLDSQ